MCPSCAFPLANLLHVHVLIGGYIAFMCFLLRCLELYESKVGMVREDDGNGGCVEIGVERECVMRGGVKKEVVGDCCRWSGTVRVDGWYRLREAIANN